MSPENSSPTQPASAQPVSPTVPVAPQLQYQAQPQIQQVSKPGNSKLPIILVIIIVIALGAGGFLFGPKLLSKLNIGNKPQEEMTFAPTPVAETTPVPEITDDPETQLEKDIKNINNKATSLDTDISDVDKGIKDQPIPQGQ